MSLGAPLAAQPAPEGSAPLVAPPPYEVRDLGLAGFREPVRSYDVLHTVLDLQVDFSRERVVGYAEHVLVPLRGGLDHLQFDARAMAIHGVTLRRGDRVDTLRTAYDGADLTVFTPGPLEEGDTVRVRIAYEASPATAAPNRGMVFVDAAGTDPSRPTQVWTLGQPEDNQYWFPTWDYPNDLMTFEVALTVPDAFTTLSNGVLVGRAPAGEGLRRDRWVLDKPQAPYLTTLAVGTFEVVEDLYRRPDGSTVPLAYYLEPAYRDRADLIFGETKAIMEILERKTGERYPWPNYKQACVRDFTAGGMESTTATLFSTELLHDERAHLHFSGVDLLAHELAHQWFGNLIPIRNWANLALSEGFATFFEQVYFEEREGPAAAQAHVIREREAYFAEAERSRRPLVWYGYDDPNLLFDAHSYQKGSQVLSMLRFELGEEAFWKGVERYVRENRHRPVVVEDLRRAMEEASGRPLGDFFQQWFLSPGHPELRVTQRLSGSKSAYEVRVRQVQDTSRTPLFAFDVDVALHFTTIDPFVQRYRVTSADTTFTIGLSAPLSYVRFDAGNRLFAEKSVSKAMGEWLDQARKDDEMAGRYEAVVALGALEPRQEIQNVLVNRAAHDPQAFVREAAVAGLRPYAADRYTAQTLLLRAREDDDARVRRAAVLALEAVTDPAVEDVLREALADPSYLVVAAAVQVLAARFPGTAGAAYRPLYELETWNNLVEEALIAALGTLHSVEGITYLHRQLDPSNEPELRAQAVAALARVAGAHEEVRTQAVGWLRPLLEDPKESVREATEEALGQLSPSSSRL